AADTHAPANCRAAPRFPVAGPAPPPAQSGGRGRPLVAVRSAPGAMAAVGSGRSGRTGTPSPCVRYALRRGLGHDRAHPRRPPAEALRGLTCCPLGVTIVALFLRLSLDISACKYQN